MRIDTKKIISILIIVIIFYFLFDSLLKNWEQLSMHIKNLNIFYIILSFIFLIIFYTIHAMIWLFIIRNYGFKISLKEALKIRSVSEIGRYTPGKVWHLIGRAYFAEKIGIPKITTLSSMVIENLSLIISAGLFFLIFNDQLIDANLLLLILLTITGLIIIRSNYFSKIINKIIKKFKKTKENINLRIPFKILLPIILSYLISWIAIGFALFFSIKGFYPQLEISSLLKISSIFAISWAIGFVSFLTPGGIGVREGIMTLLLKSYIPEAIAIIVPLLIRVVTILAEITMVITFSKIKLRRRIVIQ